LTIKYVLKNIGPQIPLIDSTTGNVMIIVDGNPIDIPKNIFEVLFEEYIEHSNENLNVFLEANKQYDSLAEQVKIMKSMGITQETLKLALFEQLPPEVHDLAKSLIEKIYS